MTVTATVVDTTTLIIGPCTAFQVDGVDLGGTANGVTIEKKQTLTDLTVDQIAGTVGVGLSDEQYVIKTQLPAATLKNLQLAWGLSQAPTTSTTPAQTTLNLGVEKKVTEHTLVFMGPASSGKQRTYTTNRAISVVAGAIDNDKKKQQVLTVEFRILPDLTKTGAEYGTVVDA